MTPSPDTLATAALVQGLMPFAMALDDRERHGRTSRGQKHAEAIRLGLALASRLEAVG